MIMKCPYCEYQYEVTPPMSILILLSDPNIPDEDYMLWMDRFVRHIGLHEYRGIMIHSGMMHKGAQPGFTVLFNEKERKLIENDRIGTSFTGPAHRGGGNTGRDHLAQFDGQ